MEPPQTPSTPARDEAPLRTPTSQKVQGEASMDSKPWYKSNILLILLLFVLFLLLVITLTGGIYMMVVQIMFIGYKCSQLEFLILAIALVIACAAVILLGLKICRQIANNRANHAHNALTHYNKMVDEVNKRKKAEFTSEVLIEHLLAACQVIISVVGLIFVLLITITAMVILGIHTQSVISIWDGEMKLGGLAEQVKVVKDENSLIHISAKNVQDLYYSQGFITAKERLFQLEVQRRIATGTLSQLIGAESLPIDKFSRTMNFAKIAQQNYEQLSDSTKEMLQSYCQGINKYVERQDVRLFEYLTYTQMSIAQFQPYELVAWFKVLQWFSSTNQQHELHRYKMLQQGIAPEVIESMLAIDANSTSTVFSAADLGISKTIDQIVALQHKFLDNSGVFAPTKLDEAYEAVTFTHQYGQWTELLFAQMLNYDSIYQSSNSYVQPQDKVLGCDFQMFSSTGPSNFMQFHLEVPSSVNSVGASIVGLPGIILGQNDNTKWCLSHSLADLQDFYVTGTSDAETYTYQSQQKSFTTRDEVLLVAGKADVKLSVKESVYGPVMNDILGIKGTNLLSMKWVLSAANDTTLNGLLAIHRSTTENSLKQAADEIQMGFVITYGVDNTRFGAIATGMIPKRKQGHNGLYPVIGDGSYDYEGFVTASTVLQSSQTTVVAANTLVAQVGVTDFSYHLDVAPEYRYSRIQFLLANITASGSADYSILASDVLSPIAAPVQAVLGLFNYTSEEEATIEGHRSAITEWSGEESAGSQAPTAFEAFVNALRMGVCSSMSNYSLPACDTKYLIDNFVANVDKHEQECTDYFASDCNTYFSTTFATSTQTLVDSSPATGDVPVYGSYDSFSHRAFFKNFVLHSTQLRCASSAFVGMTGGTQTVFFAPPNDDTLESISTTVVPNYRQFFKSDEKSLFIQSMGQGGNTMLQDYTEYKDKWASASLASFLPMKTKDYQAKHTLTLSK